MTTDSINKNHKGGDLSRLAAMLCQNPEFQEWLNNQQLVDLAISVEGAQDAAAVIRLVCGIQSRAELDHNAQAPKILQETVRRPFAERAR
mgnify:FL=1